MASLSTCHLGLWLGWQILLNLVKLHDGHLCDTSVSSEVVLSEDDAKTNDPYNINNFCTIQRT